MPPVVVSDYRKIHKIANQWAEEVIGTKRTMRGLAIILRRKFKEHGLDVAVLCDTADFGGSYEHAIGGEYDRDASNDFVLRIFYDYRLKGVPIHCDQSFIEKIRKDIIEVGCHENRHRFQNQKRGSKVKRLKNSRFDPRSDDTRYYSQSDEIDAYGVSIAVGLFERYRKGSIDKIPVAQESLVDMYWYVRSFRNKRNNKILKAVRKKIYKNVVLLSSEIGE